MASKKKKVSGKQKGVRDNFAAGDKQIAGSGSVTCADFADARAQPCNQRIASSRWS
jgi:hypothetical protein